MTLDTALFFALNSLAGRSYVLDLLIIFLAQYLPYVCIAAFLMFAYRRRREQRHVFWVPVISAVVARLCLTEIIRFFYHRPRPFMVYRVHQLLPESAWSFPSGHATFFFALATGVYFYDKKWGSGLFLAAILMTAARVIAGVHYPSDILGGMLIGIATACAIEFIAQQLYGPRENRTPISRVQGGRSATKL